MSKKFDGKMPDRLNKDRYVEFLRKKVYLQENLPFWYDAKRQRVNQHKLYSWQIDFINSNSKLSLLTAANQIGKSSIQIIKALNLGYRKELWPKYFKRKPQMFLYYMPDSKTMDVEFREKWIKTYLPSEELKDDPVWGFKVKYGKPSKEEDVNSLTLASGVTIYFRYYSQLPSRLQAVTADMVLLDEECPKSHWDELMIRSLTYGIVSMVFTATIGAEYLFRAMMLRGTKRELFPNAWKREISMFDCIYYADGTESGLFTKEKIEKEIIPTLSSKAEIDKRVYGKFVKTEGLLYQEFDEVRNTTPYKVNPNWRWVAGIDYGSGGKWGHPSSIVFCQVSPCYTMARVVKTFWSGDQRFTQGDLLAKYKELTLPLGEVETYFDWAAVDLGSLAARESINIFKAEKSHDVGIPLINALMKNGQLKICIGDETMQNQQLIQELRSVSGSVAKQKRRDDCCDALRYALSSIAFRFTALSEEKAKEIEITDPRMRFWKGLDKIGDPMQMPEDDSDDFDFEFDDALRQFEEIL